MTARTTRIPVPQPEAQRLEYRIYFAALYPLFLAAAALRALGPTGRRRRGGASRNVFGEAAEMAHSALPWAFAGQ